MKKTNWLVNHFSGDFGQILLKIYAYYLLQGNRQNILVSCIFQRKSETKYVCLTSFTIKQSAGCLVNLFFLSEKKIKIIFEI